jgi:hypothetical protein
VVGWRGLLCRKFRDVRVRERDKRDKTPSFFGGLLCHLLLRWGMVWYPTNVGEGESERSLLINDRRER